MDDTSNSNDTSLPPRKRRREDDVFSVAPVEPASYPTHLLDLHLPPRANRKQDSQPALQAGVTSSKVASGSQSTMVVRPNIPRQRSGCDDITPSDHGQINHENGSVSMMNHLQSLMLQCQFVAGQTLLKQQQEKQQQNFDVDALRRQVTTLQDDLDRTRADLARTRESLWRSDNELTHVKQRWEKDREELRVQMVVATAAKAEVSQLQSEIERMKPVTEAEIRSADMEWQEEHNQLRLAKQNCNDCHSALIQDVKKAQTSAKELADELEDLKRVHAAARIEATQKTLDRQRRIELKQANIQKEVALHKASLKAQQIACASLAKRAAQAENKLVSFHFGINILSSYFFNLLKECNIPRLSFTKKKRRKTNGEDEHDLWDVQAAMKALMEKLKGYVQEIRDRDGTDLDDYELGCPLCAAGEPKEENGNVSMTGT
ncbi:hypothetical protein CPB83DRAFT_908123 [Crepidotus variabilis]|uniref:Uncharacterized protein n=1 Tax=Crepidotus variabilis TaxID=179855 RepID=A0A9P6EDF3_9AGAR|nr:hypothetical protein CPB83DRAFT_908123 [Crepidotus variabilis]